MPDNWKKKLKELKRSFAAEKPSPSGRDAGNAKAGRKTGLPKDVDPKATWRGGSASESREAKRMDGVRPGLPAEPAPGSGPVFNIGLDIGTSGLKVCVCPPGMNSRTYVLPIGTARVSQSAVCPSTVVVEGGQIWFGQEAENRVQRGGQVFRQLKLCVACEVGIRPEVPVLSCRCKRLGDGRCSAMFALTSASEDVLASDLLTLLLGWAMGESRRRIPRELISGGLPRTTYSVSVPVDQIDAAPN